MQYRNFGKFIKLKRLKLKYSLNQFAILSEIDSASLSRFEHNKSDIYFSNFIKIANGFNMSPAELLKEFEKKN